MHALPDYFHWNQLFFTSCPHKYMNFYLHTPIIALLASLKADPNITWKNRWLFKRNAEDHRLRQLVVLTGLCLNLKRIKNVHIHCCRNFQLFAWWHAMVWHEKESWSELQLLPLWMCKTEGLLGSSCRKGEKPQSNYDQVQSSCWAVLKFLTNA